MRNMTQCKSDVMHAAVDSNERKWNKKAISIAPTLKNFVVEALRGGEHFQETGGDFCIDNFVMREQNCTDDCKLNVLHFSHQTAKVASRSSCFLCDSFRSESVGDGRGSR